MAQVSYGAITITDITDIENIQNWYLATDLSSGVTKNNPDTGHGIWTTDIQNAMLTSTFQYLWNYEKVLGTGNVEISSTQPIIIGHFGVDGADGADGADGNSIVSIDEYYKITDSPIVTSTNPGSDNWQKNTLVVPTNSQRYLWNYQVINYSKTGSEGSYEEAHIIGIHGDTGPQGNAGINTATVYLYQRATSVPSKPNSTLTYTFSNATLSGTLGNWKQSISELTGTNPIWVIAAVASSNGATDTIASSEWSTQIKLAENGVAGLNQATIYIYKRAISVTTPGSVTYTFSNGSFSVPSGWSKTIPTSDGNPCYVTSAVAIGNGLTATLTWNTPSILVEDGVSPTVTSTSNGVKIVDAEGNETYITNGTDGTSYYTHVRYSENSNGSNYVSSPTSSTIYIGVYSGTLPTAPDYNDSGWKWSRYVGNDGISVTGTRELYYLKTNSTNVPPITSSAQITTTDVQNAWTSVIPTYITNAEYYTCIETSLSNNTKVWSAPIVNNALTNANEKALDAYNTSVARDTEVNALKAQAKHYWWDSQGAHVAAGINTTNVNNITQGTPATYGFNSLMSPGALKLRYQDIDFAQLATSGLTFFRPAVEENEENENEDPTYVQGKKAMALTVDALTFYKPLAYNSAEEPATAATLSSTGLNIVEGSITLGDNFSVDSEGSLIAKDGTVGGWTIGEFSLHSTDHTTWDANLDGIFIGQRESDSGKTIFTISGGKNQYIQSEEITINENNTYYEKEKTLTADTEPDDAKDYYSYNSETEEYILIDSTKEYVLSEDTNVVANKNYYTYDDTTEIFTKVENPSGNPSENYYYELVDCNPFNKGWYEDTYKEVENPSGSPYDNEYYISTGPMWYINSDGTANFGSLVVNQRGILDVPAAAISGKLTADQIEVNDLAAISANIGSTINSETTINGFEINSRKKVIDTLDTREIDKKEYVNYTEGGAPITEIVEESFINLNTEKNIYILTTDTTITSGKSYYSFNPNYTLTEDIKVEENKIYYRQSKTGSGDNIDFIYSKVNDPSGNPKEQEFYESHPKYDLIIPSSANPYSENLYEIQKNYSANIILEEGKMSISSNDKIVIETNENDGINISNGNIADKLKIGGLELIPYNNGLAVQVGGVS